MEYKNILQPLQANMAADVVLIGPPQEIGDINTVQKTVYLINQDFLYTVIGAVPCLIYSSFVRGI